MKGCPLLLSATFTAKSELVLVLTQEDAFSQRFHFKEHRKEHRFINKTVLGVFKKPSV